MENIIQAICTVGFPIVMCLLEGYYIFSRADKTRDVIEENNVVLAELKDTLEYLAERGE